MKKRYLYIFLTVAAILSLVLVSVLVYNLQIREFAEKSEIVAIRSTPISAFPLQTIIKGLTTDNTISFLEDNDFICPEKPAAYKSGYFRTSCEQKAPEYDMTVHIFSSNPQKIYLVDVQINQLTHPSNDQAENFLGFVTGLPFQGMDGNSVKAWISTALPAIDHEPGMVVEKNFNGLVMRLYGPPQLRSLEIIGN